MRRKLSIQHTAHRRAVTVSDITTAVKPPASAHRLPTIDPLPFSASQSSRRAYITPDNELPIQPSNATYSTPHNRQKAVKVSVLERTSSATLHKSPSQIALFQRSAIFGILESSQRALNWPERAARDSRCRAVRTGEPAAARGHRGVGQRSPTSVCRSPSGGPHGRAGQR